jgi:hypothetical protein
MNIYEYEDTLEYKIAVMQAALEGKPVEFCEDDTWRPIHKPSWDWWETEYRIAKPKPLPSTEERLASLETAVAALRTAIQSK